MTVALVYALSSAGVWLSSRNREKRLENFSRCTHFFSAIMLRAIGLDLQVHHRAQSKKIRGGTLLVANHLSYLDILILASIRPMLFISSVELAHTFFLGHLAKLGGTVFVERRSPAFLPQELAKVAHLLRRNFVVVLFPEAGTSDGEEIRPFKSALFQAAVQAGTRVQPACIRYTHLDGIPVTSATRRRVVWHGTLFPVHAIKLLTHKGIQAEVDIFPPLEARSCHRKELARHCLELIQSRYQHAW